MYMVKQEIIQRLTCKVQYNSYTTYDKLYNSQIE